MDPRALKHHPFDPRAQACFKDIVCIDWFKPRPPTWWDQLLRIPGMVHAVFTEKDASLISRFGGNPLDVQASGPPLADGRLRSLADHFALLSGDDVRYATPKSIHAPEGCWGVGVKLGEKRLRYAATDAYATFVLAQSLLVKRPVTQAALDDEAGSSGSYSPLSAEGSPIRGPSPLPCATDESEGHGS